LLTGKWGINMRIDKSTQFMLLNICCQGNQIEENIMGRAFSRNQETMLNSIPGTTRKKSSGSGTGSTQPREYN
jgi:hypothetical protein